MPREVELTKTERLFGYAVKHNNDHKEDLPGESIFIKDFRHRQIVIMVIAMQFLNLLTGTRFAINRLIIQFLKTFLGFQVSLDQGKYHFLPPGGGAPGI